VPRAGGTRMVDRQKVERPERVDRSERPERVDVPAEAPAGRRPRGVTRVVDVRTAEPRAPERRAPEVRAEPRIRSHARSRGSLSHARSRESLSRESRSHARSRAPRPVLSRDPSPAARPSGRRRVRCHLSRLGSRPAAPRWPCVPSPPPAHLIHWKMAPLPSSRGHRCARRRKSPDPLRKGQGRPPPPPLVRGLCGRRGRRAAPGGTPSARARCPGRSRSPGPRAGGGRARSRL
jgi:hypothetical protein